jgi:oxygen-independent coproporphyrinogen-3 oxidase
MEASLYVHVPFCSGVSRGKCDYCDFYSVPVEPGDPRLERYIDTLLLEGEKLFEKFRPERIPTLYLGGGTPSVLGAVGISALLEGISRLIGRFSPPPEEITLEANPESADEAFLAAARAKGATRLSLGVQSLHGPSRLALNRIGSSVGEALLFDRLRLAAAYFPGAFSADLISGLPLQSENVLLDDIAALLSYKPAHVSLYSLIVEDGTPLAVKTAEAKSREPFRLNPNGAKPIFLPNQDEADRLWIFGRDALEKSGYSQYEVSNFCLDGKESRHNLRYWQMKNWLALGPSASGTLIEDSTGSGFRYTILPDLNCWIDSRGSSFHKDSIPSFEELDNITLIKETLMMGFRCTEGPDEELFRLRFHRTIGECIGKTASSWRKHGFLRKDRYALSKEGLLFLNGFLSEAFRELDALRYNQKADLGLRSEP